MKKRWDLSTLYLMTGLTLAGILFSFVADRQKTIYVDQVVLENVDFEEEMIPLSGGAQLLNAAGAGKQQNGEAINLRAVSVGNAAVDVSETGTMPILNVQPSGVLVKRGNHAVIDYSNMTDGYVMVQYESAAASRMKVQVKGPVTTYTYNLPAQHWTAFPLSDGNGNYQVSVFQNVSGNRYAQLLSAGFAVELTDEFAPFLRPNQYVDYSAASETVALAGQLTAGIKDPLKMVELVYDYVVENLSYDYEKAAKVTSGYLPVLDSVLAEKKGICFDYAALMTGMLRSQQIPCKLVVGYAGEVYHAWISVWTKETGWVDGVIYFDSDTWHRMDPTFASSGQRSDTVMQFIGDETNYTTKYLY